jgi:ABC-type nitrate/sulfonate/bicarbonate transport system permease component
VKRTDGEHDVVSLIDVLIGLLIDVLIGTLVGILTDRHTGRYG